VVAELGTGPHAATVLARGIRAHRPELARSVVLFASDLGLPGQSAALEGLEHELLAKPTSASDLIGAVERAIARRTG
jgi:hypothetical protein